MTKKFEVAAVHDDGVSYPANNAGIAYPKNPAKISYPATLPIELALRVAPVSEVCEAYNLTKADWMDLCADPRFRKDLAAAAEMIRKEGMSFKLKAQLQSEELLNTSWRMIHAPPGEVPPSVRADLLKFTVRCAGLESQPSDKIGSGANLQININL